MNDYQFSIRDVPAIPVAFATDDTAVDQFGPTIGRLLGVVGGAMAEQGVTQAGAPFCRCTDWRETECTADIGIPIAGAFASTDAVKAEVLGGVGPCLCFSYFGPYEGLRGAYDDAAKWIASNGYEWNGAPWESYITDPGEEPDSAKWQTDIFIPVSKAAA